MSTQTTSTGRRHECKTCGVGHYIQHTRKREKMLVKKVTHKVIQDVKWPTDHLPVLSSFATNISNEARRVKGKMDTMFTEKEMTRHQSRIKGKSGSGCYNISGQLFKQIIKANGKVLLEAMNKAYKEGIFPQSLKISKAIQIPKNDVKEKQLKDLRTICVINPFTKMMEVLVKERMEYWVQRNKKMKFHELQFGITGGKNVILSIEQLVQFMQRVPNTVILKVDVTNAYEMVDHQVLTNILTK